MSLDLFSPLVPTARMHLAFAMLLEPQYAPEREVLRHWAQGFEDRDGKFVQEFQLSFESSFWELYLHAALRSWGLRPDMSIHSPDFVVQRPKHLVMEAAIAAPPAGGPPAFGRGAPPVPEDFSAFNAGAVVRLCNSFDAKVRRYRSYYATLPHVQDAPFVIALGAFDRPLAHLAASRPIMAALYGLYHDEEATAQDADTVTSYNVVSAAKSESVDIPVGLFCTDAYAEVSAVVYSALATWGKVRALADNSEALTWYRTFHPQEGTLLPRVELRRKCDYQEDVMDGLWVLHNPFARHPVPAGMLSHTRVAEVRVADDGELKITAPDDFLLVRMLHSLIERRR